MAIKMAKNQWHSTRAAIEAALAIVRRSPIWVDAHDSPALSRSQLAAQLKAGGHCGSRSAAYRLINRAVDDGLLRAVDADSGLLCLVLDQLPLTAGGESAAVEAARRPGAVDALRL